MAVARQVVRVVSVERVGAGGSFDLMIWAVFIMHYICVSGE